jgi:response regulator NasT
MRVLVITSDPARAAIVAEALGEAEVRAAPSLESADLAADLIVIARDCADRGTLNGLRRFTGETAPPVAMFVDRSEPGLAEAAVQAGLAAYVVDGLYPSRIQGVVEVAMSRFQIMRQLKTDLAKAKSDLSERKTVERAKGLLMKERGLDEEAAYGLLRKLAMDSGKSLATVAADLIAFAGVLKGGS